MKKKILIILSIIIVILAAGAIGINLSNREEPATPEIVDENKVIENIPTKEIPDGITNIDEEGLEIEGFEESNPDMISGSNAESDDWVLGAHQSSPVYYSQIDSRWRNHPYTITGNPKQTIGTSGCGPTSAAMVVSTIKGTIIPPDMGDLFLRNGFRTTNNGTYHSAFKWTANYFGIDFKTVNSTYAMADAVSEGYLTVVACGKGLWTTGGHYIVVMGREGDTLKVYDPYLYNGKFNSYGRQAAGVRVEGTTAYVSIENFKKYSNASAFFCFYNDNKDTKPEEPVTPSINSYTMYVTAKSGLNVRTGAGTNYSRIRTISKNTAVTVYETSNGWSRIGDNEWVSSEYLSSNPVSTNTTSTSTNYTAKITAKSGLRIRAGTGTNYKVLGTYSYGTTITVLQESSGWARTSKGWVSINYITKVSSNTQSKPSNSGTTSSKYSLGRYKVNTSSGLNVRTGPSTGYRKKRLYKNGTAFDTYEIRGNWARTPSGWVSLSYCRLLYKY